MLIKKSYMGILCSLLICLFIISSAQTPQRKAVYLSYNDAKDTLSLIQKPPAELSLKNPNELQSAWTEWVKKSDKEIRSRLAQGDEDSIINFLLFGTAFTKQPRVTPRQIEEINKEAGNAVTAGERINAIMQARINDFVQALANVKNNERLSFAGEFISSRNDFRLNTMEGQLKAKEFLLRSLARVLQESDNYTRILQQARLLGNPSAEFAERSKLYHNRGLSSDTSLRPNYAIDEALKELKSKGLIKAAGIRRVAVVGPGLDFTDKQEGYDFYPQQTIQPFAVIDTLIRLGLTKATDIKITTLDLSPKVNDHIARARANGLKKQPYTLQLPFDTKESWKPGFIRYWETFGSHIGTQTKPVDIPTNAGDMKLRAVKVNPIFAAKLTPLDTNIVLQHLELPDAEKFDLIIGTNIFVYYNEFEQSLAMLNVGKMLRLQGILLSNNSLLELPTTKMKSVGYSTVVYSDKPDDGDIIVWYQRQAN